MFAYFDCYSGISGDMTLGALVALGVPVPWLSQELEALSIPPFKLTAKPVKRQGIRGVKVSVQCDDQETSRNYAQIKRLIQESRLSEPVKTTGLSIFEALALAEAKVHDCPLGAVHFHEVGGIDAIVDIMGTALALDYLKVEKIGCAKIPLGNGFAFCKHGRIPVPAPATVELLKGFEVYGTHIEAELVTPTGAAILKGLDASCGELPDMTVEGVGYGAGDRELEAHPNLLRVILGEPGTANVTRRFNDVLVETCIDDMNPEYYGFLMDRLFEDGALDVYLTPVYMKKNRPATMVQVLCPGACKDIVIGRILSETTTSGVRTCPVERVVLNRKIEKVETVFGKVSVKKIISPSGQPRYAPEFEECKKIALQEGLPLLEVYRVISHHANTACPLTKNTPANRDML